jgi:hypothetical protein
MNSFSKRFRCSSLSPCAFQERTGISSTDLFTYNVTKDGKRFVVNRYVKPENIAPLEVLLHAGGMSGNSCHCSQVKS